jgi:hypothetical protein
MAVSLVSTGITFPDNTTQTTAATASAPSPWVLLSTVTGSSVSTIDVETTFSSTYDYYKIIVPELYQSTSSFGQLYIRLKMGGAYQSGSNAYNTIFTYATGSSTVGQSSQYTTNGNLAGYNGVYVGNQGNGKSAIEITVWRPSSTTAFKYIDTTTIFPGTGGGQSTPNMQESRIVWSGDGYGNDSSSTLTGVRIYEGSGGTLTGTARLYGLKNS